MGVSGEEEMDSTNEEEEEVVEDFVVVAAAAEVLEIEPGTNLSKVSLIALGVRIRWHVITTRTR